MGKASKTAKANSSIIGHIANERGGLTKFFSKPEQGGRLYFLNLFFFRAFIAWEKGIPIDPTKEQAQRSNLEEYRAKLKIEDVVLPVPFTINGWLDQTAICHWPNLYFRDISEFLGLKHLRSCTTDSAMSIIRERLIQVLKDIASRHFVAILRFQNYSSNSAIWVTPLLPRCHLETLTSCISQ